MAATPIAFATKDSAQGNLDSGISAASTSIPLQSGDGAAFPQPYSSTATSGGSSTALNCTGISATIGGSAQAGQWIYNLTDGSVAVIVTVNANDLVTTRLLGGSDNTWQNADRWCIAPFVATFAKVDDSGVITQSEEALIIGRSTDTLTVASGGRGYNSTSANTFDADDYVYLFVTSPITERLKDVLSVLDVQVNTNVTNIASNTTSIGTLQDGTYHYVVTTGSANAYVAATPALGSYTAGNLVVFKANFTNTGSATLNLNGLGAKTIKKIDGATNLAANDIISGQIVVVRYDGTNFQMLSPIGQVLTSTVTNLGTVTTASSNVGSSSTAENTMSPTWTGTNTIPTNALTAGSVVEIMLGGQYRVDDNANDNLYISLYLGANLIGKSYFATTGGTSGDTQDWSLRAFVCVRTGGATGTFWGQGMASFFVSSSLSVTVPMRTTSAGDQVAATGVDFTGTLAVIAKAQFDDSDVDNKCNIQSGKITIHATP